MAEAVAAELLVTDDAAAFKGVADALDLGHQVCISHVTRNTQALAEELLDALAADADGSLRASGIAPQQAVADLRRIGECILTRDPVLVDELEEIHLRYVHVRLPRPGEQATLAYRMRMLTLDRSACHAAGDVAAPDVLPAVGGGQGRALRQIQGVRHDRRLAGPGIGDGEPRFVHQAPRAG